MATEATIYGLLEDDILASFQVVGSLTDNLDDNIGDATERVFRALQSCLGRQVESDSCQDVLALDLSAERGPAALAMANISGCIVLIGIAYLVGWFKSEPWRREAGAPAKRVAEPRPVEARVGEVKEAAVNAAGAKARVPV